MAPNVGMIAKTVGGFVAKNSPSILTGVGVAGLVTTVVMAVKGTPKALRLIKEEEDRRFKENHELRRETLSKTEIIKLTWQCYVPTFLMGASTVAAVIWSNSINLRRNTALAAVYGLAQTTIEEYQKKVVETIGERKELEMRENIAQDKLNANPIDEKSVILTNRGDTLCFDSLSGRYFRFDVEKINKFQNEFNKELLNERWISLNNWYQYLGLEGTELGKTLGWSTDDPSMLEITYTAKVATNNEPCIVLNYKLEPSRP